MVDETIFSDMERRLTIEDDGNVRVIENTDVIHQSIKMILSTSPGERVMLPQFGSGLKDYLFEPMDEDTIDDMVDDIEESLAAFEPRINVTRVRVIPDDINNRYEIVITYQYVIGGLEEQFVGRVKAANLE